MPRSRDTEITLILSVAAVVTWVAIVIVVFQRQPVLGGDFMQFYVLGTLARAGDWAGSTTGRRFTRCRCRWCRGRIRTTTLRPIRP
jgi:uncharacterized membrane protein